MTSIQGINSTMNFSVNSSSKQLNKVNLNKSNAISFGNAQKAVTILANVNLHKTPTGALSLIGLFSRKGADSIQKSLNFFKKTGLQHPIFKNSQNVEVYSVNQEKLLEKVSLFEKTTTQNSSINKNGQAFLTVVKTSDGKINRYIVERDPAGAINALKHVNADAEVTKVEISPSNVRNKYFSPEGVKISKSVKLPVVGYYSMKNQLLKQPFNRKYKIIENNLPDEIQNMTEYLNGHNRISATPQRVKITHYDEKGNKIRSSKF